MGSFFSDKGVVLPAPIGIPEHTYCHELIAKTAKEMARHLYDRMATRSNEFFREVPEEQVFVDAVWPGLVEDARATLVEMLKGSYPDELKDEIARAIILDNTLVRGRPERVASRLRTAQTPTALMRAASET